jgi:hypothetical protein
MKKMRFKKLLGMCAVLSFFLFPGCGQLEMITVKVRMINKTTDYVNIWCDNESMALSNRLAPGGEREHTVTQFVSVDEDSEEPSTAYVSVYAAIDGTEVASVEYEVDGSTDFDAIFIADKTFE